MGRTTVTANPLPLVLAVLAFPPAASAYETDQITGRDEPLADVVELANAEMDRLLDAAVARVNRLTGCTADEDRLHKVLAREIRDETAARRWVWSRGFWRAPGFGVFSKWMEVDPAVDRLAFRDREDIYGDLKLFQAPILAVAGPCSTFQMAGVRLGSDKMDHFLAEGFQTWLNSGDGADPARAAALSTRTENHVYGLDTSAVFSFADLRANWDGFEFYAGLLSPGSVIERGEDGCVQRVRPFDWSVYVDWQYDEALDPPVYRPEVQAHVQETIRRRADEYCRTLPEWAPDGWAALRDRYALTGDEPWLGPDAPAQGDPFALDLVCQPEEADAEGVATPSGE